MAEKLKTAGATKIVVLTEDTDPNDLLGRPNGYTSAAVAFDGTLDPCSKPGVDCGLTIEVWPSPEEVTRRAEYIQGALKAAPMLGTEYHAPRGTALLRGSGKLKPSVWQKYKAAFES